MSVPLSTQSATDTNEPLLSMRDVSIAFPGERGKPATEVVSHADLEVYPGETVAIVGESGSGKSTIVSAAMGLLPPGGAVTSGTIRFDGSDITHASEREFQNIRGNGIGLVPQDPMTNLNPVWTIGAQVRESLRANNIASGSAAHDKAVELLEQAGLEDAKSREGQYPHQFSGGMRQRALIAMGLAARPKLLIADEPTSALDVTVAKRILDHLSGLTKELGTSVVLITHDLGLAADRADRLVVMERGRIVESGPAADILYDPRHPYTKRLIAAAPSLAARRGDRVVSTPTRPDEECAKMVVAKDLRREFSVPGDKPWRKDTFVAVDGVSFTLRQGRTIGIVGESGSGKSTVANMALGLLEPTAGEVLFDGEPVHGRNRKQELELRRRIQPIFQNPYATLDPMRSVHAAIEEPLKIHGVGNRKERAERVAEMLDRVALPKAMARRFPVELSGGQRQRVAIARALALNPEVVVCDEAVSALDVIVQAQVLELLAELQEELDLAYLFITHDLAVVRQVADEVIVMEAGKVVEHRETDALFDAPEQEYTRKLLDAIPGAEFDPGR
ncbi:ABC transporter ATP-binding protein [Corynebacterium sp. TAE3-ERU12]|uniref:dipeptide ABC transporter ATP-binding protein n=1 Tax=Corynebacterium sp. TAE3-ERU12 TaxID=2849491 RepID=UPI001C47A141|nr:ABC transporter ATP-binding protein [Corynebacterium sp. TAE3-ERU12]MBV7294697.1 ABC transporter ATP-binding protein [Corynebacterium sp. TAE3-ERU12]